ncbi:uncharacterized protein B0I36DRAFT_61500 [Microdochium trichocladiopsis]|uniref:Uncharacterized protein n=1 Tax=Microdochium trichocladiopsis TaxID=1682393 RepID=A0A9P8YDW0_9PEZI|nr:uncharacterized protein B0I36DRAFT_61500 [Microdochium trichocladiopsis]KAH7037072.1 hypothetical protein B0I36DRAFT_61500 [Microdochium trichocladiopsis]
MMHPYKHAQRSGSMVASESSASATAVTSPASPTSVQASSTTEFPSSLDQMSTTVGSPSSSRTVRAMTTPYVKPSKCTGRFITTTVMQTISPDYKAPPTTTQVTLYLSDSSGTCEGDGEIYSPAVCPSSWTAWWMGPAMVGGSNDPQNLYWGRCCAGGFTPNSAKYDQVEGETYDCVSGGRGTVYLTATTRGYNEDALSTYTITNFDQVHLHKAWEIQWMQSDVSKLSPSPPPLGLCTTTALRSWAPGLPTDSALAAMEPCYQPYDGCCGGENGLLYFVIIFPICMFLLIAGCCTWCWCRFSRKRRISRAEARGVVVVENAAMPNNSQSGVSTAELMTK